MASAKFSVEKLEMFIFWSNRLQVPLYLSPIIVRYVYVYLFMLELSHPAVNAFSTAHINETEVMLVVLGLIDVLMMVSIGGYETFVSRRDIEDHLDQPEWLSHVNAGELKIKLSTAIIGISSIHLLKTTFINAGNLREYTIKLQVIIHVVFLFSVMVLTRVDKVMNQTLQTSKADR